MGEKEKWRTVTKGQDDRVSAHSHLLTITDDVSSKEKIHLEQKLLIRAAEALSGSVGMHIMIYTSYICDKEPYASS